MPVSRLQRTRPDTPTAQRRSFRLRDALVFPSTLFGLVLVLIGAGCPLQLARWETEDRQLVASQAPDARGINPDALRPATVLWLCVLPVVGGGALLVRGYRQAWNEHVYGDPAPDLRAREADVLYDAGRQLPKVRFIHWLSVLSAAGSLWGAAAIIRQTGNAGVPPPALERWALALFVALAGAAFLAGMHLYSRHYLAEVRRAGPADLLMRFPRLLGTAERRYPRAAVRFGAERAGRARAVSVGDDVMSPGISVRAPWIPVYVPDRRWPLIMDAQGWFRRAPDSELDIVRR